MENMTREKIAKLQMACHYWSLAKKETNESYYQKAYTVFLREMGAEYPLTLELRKEMTESLSNQAAGRAAV